MMSSSCHPDVILMSLGLGTGIGDLDWGIGIGDRDGDGKWKMGMEIDLVLNGTWHCSNVGLVSSEYHPDVILSILSITVYFICIFYILCLSLKGSAGTTWYYRSSKIKCKKLQMKYTVNTVHFTVLQYTLFAFFTFYVWALRVVLALPGTTLHQPSLYGKLKHKM